jgi:hypothetical protein
MQILRILFLVFSISLLSNESFIQQGLHLYSGSKNVDGSFTFEKVGLSLPFSNNTIENVKNLYKNLNGKFLISADEQTITVYPGEDNYYRFYWIGQFDSKYEFKILKNKPSAAQFTFVVSEQRPIFARSDNTEDINKNQNNLFSDIYKYLKNIKSSGQSYNITKTKFGYVVFLFQGQNIENIFTYPEDWINSSK